MKKNKIRVLMIIRQGMVGGGETHLYDLVTNINMERFEPIVLSFTGGAMIDKLNDKNIQTYVIPTKSPFNLSVSKRIKQLLVEQNISLIHIHGTRAATNSLFSALSLKIPIIYTVHGWSFNDNQSKLMKFARTAVESFITKNVNATICVSESNFQTGKSSIKGFAAEVINNGISFQKFNHQISGQEARYKLSFGEGEIWIGFIARMTYQKNPLGLLEAFRIAHNANNEVRLLMVGEGELEDDIKEKIEVDLLKDIVKYLPFQQNTPEILSALDIFCLPSRWEGLSIGLLEAMAMKKPVIATNVDGTKELIEHNVNGYLVEKDDTDSLASAIIELSTNGTKLKKFAENAFITITEQFAVQKMVHSTESVYERVISPYCQ